MRYELLARELVALGHEVVWWSSDFHHLRKKRREVEPVYTDQGIQIRLVATAAYRANVSWARLRSHRLYAGEWQRGAAGALARGELKCPDALIFSVPPLGLYDAARHFKDCCGCRLFADVQDAWPENFYQLAPGALRWVLKLLLHGMHKRAQRTYTGCDYLTAVSEKYLRLAESYGCRCEREVFPLGRLLPERSEAGESDDRFLKLVYIGNLGVSYDLETMLQGVVRLSEEGVALRLEIAGDGPGRRRVEEYVRKHGGVIRFHGYLPEKELSALMRGCDVGIIPMKEESLVAVPNKLVDYASHGLAVINGLTSESDALLQRCRAGVLYERGSVESFKGAVMDYYKERELLKQHQQNSRKMAEELFDAHQISSAMARWIAQSCDH